MLFTRSAGGAQFSTLCLNAIRSALRVTDCGFHCLRCCLKMRFACSHDNLNGWARLGQLRALRTLHTSRQGRTQQVLERAHRTSHPCIGAVVFRKDSRTSTLFRVLDISPNARSGNAANEAPTVVGNSQRCHDRDERTLPRFASVSGGLRAAIPVESATCSVVTRLRRRVSDTNRLGGCSLDGRRARWPGTFSFRVLETLEEVCKTVSDL
jgi:hypothetical protein